MANLVLVVTVVGSYIVVILNAAAIAISTLKLIHCNQHHNPEARSCDIVTTMTIFVLLHQN